MYVLLSVINGFNAFSFYVCLDLDIPRVIRDRNNPFTEFTDDEFRMRFRLPKTSLQTVLNLIQEKLEYPSKRNSAVSPLNQLLLTLRFYATSSFQVSERLYTHNANNLYFNGIIDVF